MALLLQPMDQQHLHVTETGSGWGEGGMPWTGALPTMPGP
jgi:hypothetical protein